MREHRESALFAIAGGFFVFIGVISGGDRPVAAVVSVVVGLVAVLFAAVRFDVGRRGVQGDGLLSRIRRGIGKVPIDQGTGIAIPTTDEEWRRWSKPRRRWLMALPALVVLGFVLTVLDAPVWMPLTAFVAAILSQAPTLYYEWREDHRGNGSRNDRGE